MNENYTSENAGATAFLKSKNFDDFERNSPKLINFSKFNIYLLFFLLLVSKTAMAQVSTYTFAQSTATYTPLATSTVVHSASWDDNVASATIPFTYTYNGVGYTSVSVNSNGYVTFGATLSQTTGYNPIGSNRGYAGAIAAFGQDLINNGAPIVSGVEGVAPNRVFVLQWTNARRFDTTNGVAVAGDVLNFQIRLSETSNSAQLRYGTCTATTTTAYTCQVGLRGSSTDFNNRRSTTSWTSTTSGGGAGNSVTTTNTILPTNGLTFTYTPAPDPFAPYCSNVVYSLAVEPITLVNFAGINRSSGAAVDGTASIQNFTANNGNVTTQTSYPMTIKGNTDGNFTNYFRVFIDWNHDGDFLDAGESLDGGSITNSTGLDAIQASSTIFVPATALAGPTRLRIKKLFATTAPTTWDACTGGDFGQTEDYTLNITLCTPLNWYVDNDGDTFGNTASLVSACLSPGANYVLVGGDCNDNQIQYADLDGDGFGSTTQVACGVANNTDSNDNLLTYVDADADGFGSTTFAPSGVTNNTDCNDNQLQYTDADSDGFGALPYVACGGLLNNLDCNDSQLRYADLDADGFGSTTFVACGGVLNNTDCNDAAATVYPGAIEICYDGLDNNCNGTIDEGCTPIVSVIQSAQCGVTLSTIDQDVFANLVSGAQGYRFRVTNTATNQVQTIDRFLRVFKITQLPVFAFNTTYQVEVSIRFNNVWQPFYGTPCTVSTPATTTQLQSSQCGGTLTSMADVIYANNVPFATGYRFRVTNLVTSAQQVLVRSLREFRMNLLTNPSYNATYSVEVAVRNTDGTYLPYGPVCNITTPSFPTSEVQAAQCNYTALSNTETIFATSVAGATVYRFRLTNPALGYSYTIDRTTRTFTLGLFPSLQSGTTYTIQVSLQIGGVFGPFGKACSLTTPGIARQETTAPVKVQATAVDFKATAYPNPFASDFKLNVTTSSEEKVQVRVYDMLGKLVEDKQVATTEIESLEVGASYPSGVYNVIVSQGENTQTLRVIKR